MLDELQVFDKVLYGLSLDAYHHAQAYLVKTLKEAGYTCLREMDAYAWDLSAGAKDRVKKENDHAMDDMRYFVSTVLGEQKAGFAVCSVARKR